MTFFSILETLLIGPLKLVFEVIFDFANQLIGHPGLAIIFLSLIMNILVLPLYRRADAMQEESRDREAALAAGVKHIKKTFTGDERMMILQAYYRQNNYKPTHALKGSVSLLLEIPFFIAAYQFLSHLDILNGVSLGPITNLGAPDGLLVIGGMAINLLPILMTLINVISSALYLKGFPTKTKVQLYAMALFFLVFLYSSPACLVFYWTLNNLFSLVKTIFYKLKNPRKVLDWLCAVVGLAIAVFGAVFYSAGSVKLRVFISLVGLLLILPLVLSFIKKVRRTEKKPREAEPNRKIFLSGSVFLTVLVGALIPSAFIAASPQEYIDVTYFHNPLWYIVSSLCLAAGLFLIWMRVFYWLASPKGKTIFDKLVWIMCGLTIINYMLFGTNLGVISSALQYDNGLSFSLHDQLVNIAAILAVGVLLYLVIRYWKRAVSTILIVATVSLCAMSAINLITITSSVSEITAETSEADSPHFALSQNGKNVVIIMLDRAMGVYVPYIFNEKPELMEKFSGFTYYENTVSLGGYTNFGAPMLFGGYEYSPVEMNKRESETLVSKHNEALKVMPAIFSDRGYDVTICDPTYANYKWIPDLSIYNEYPNVNTYITKGSFGKEDEKQAAIDNNYRNFFCFSIMKSMPLFIQSDIYNDGRYHHVTEGPGGSTDSGQTRKGLSVSAGISNAFMEPYNVLVNLPNMTDVTDDSANTFMFLTNDLTHEPMMLSEPDYLPAQNVDNTKYDRENESRFTVNGRKLIVENGSQMIHYQTNMAAMIQLGNWFDYMRENGVYDNTRIIIVADHGRALGQSEELILDDGSDTHRDMEFYFPLLLVKDFDSHGFTTSDEFMTSADVPTLAMQNLIDDPINPFTGKVIDNSEKYAHDQFVILSEDWNIAKNNGNTYLPSAWASVHDNIWDRNNWTFFDEKTTLPEP